MKSDRIESVYVLPPDGTRFRDVDGACDFLASSGKTRPTGRFGRYEVGVRYRNGNEVRGQFEDKMMAIGFLRDMQSGPKRLPSRRRKAV